MRVWLKPITVSPYRYSMSSASTRSSMPWRLPIILLTWSISINTSYLPFFCNSNNICQYSFHEKENKNFFNWEICTYTQWFVHKLCINLKITVFWEVIPCNLAVYYIAWHLISKVSHCQESFRFHLIVMYLNCNDTNGREFKKQGTVKVEAFSKIQWNLHLTKIFKQTDNCW